MSKKVVVTLIIVAVILASFSLAYHYFDLSGKIPTKSSQELVDSSGGKVGIQILPPEIEDKGVENNGG